MTYAQIIDNEITTVGRLPRSARHLDTREWVMGLATANVELQQACGWHEVVQTVRPADTDTHTHDRSVEIVKGAPTVVWTEREWSAEELAARAERAAYVPPEKRLDALERVLVDKSVATDAEIEAAREARSIDTRR